VLQPVQAVAEVQALQLVGQAVQVVAGLASPKYPVAQVAQVEAPVVIVVQLVILVTQSVPAGCMVLASVQTEQVVVALEIAQVAQLLPQAVQDLSAATIYPVIQVVHSLTLD
jgi:hypothetical protein